jgi:hypothetical protein
MLILHITILNRSQRIKQFQKPLANLAVAKLDLHVSVGNTLDWLGISISGAKRRRYSYHGGGSTGSDFGEFGDLRSVQSPPKD